MSAGICRVAGGVLVLLIGAALALGGAQLWRGGSQAWPDVVANDLVVRRTSGGMLVMAVLLLIAGLVALGHVALGGWAASIAVTVVVLAAFWVNYALFGSIRPLHMVTNIAVAALIFALLWFGYAKQTS